MEGNGTSPKWGPRPGARDLRFAWSHDVETELDECAEAGATARGAESEGIGQTLPADSAVLGGGSDADVSGFADYT